MEVHISGEIVGASDGPSCSGTHCCWTFDAGNNWRVLQGVTEGHTHTDSATDVEGTSVWASPFDIHYACSSLAGWPKLRLETFVQDVHGRNDVGGYGFCHVPAAPGEHDTDIVLWRPEGSKLDQLRAYFVGGYPKLRDPTIVSEEGDRYELSTSTMGRAHVQFKVTLRGASDHGIVCD